VGISKLPDILQTFLKIDSSRDQLPDDGAAADESMKHGGYGRTEVWVL
jgi:hypothetical protein